MDVETFVVRWSGQEGGAERANYALFLTELCDVLGVDHPKPAQATRTENDYVFERAVQPRAYELTTAPRRIDLYKRGSFILEAKQSRLAGHRKAMPTDERQQQLFGVEEEGRPFGNPVAAGWDALMANARRQAEEYVFRLPPDHTAPPFLIVCDVGRVFEIYSDFSGSGRNYTQFPDRQSFRIALSDIRRPETLDRLRRVWDDPHSLDPTAKSAAVTQGIARQLAVVSQALERKYAPHDVAMFLMRCIFTMFAEDVELLPKDSFTSLLQHCLDDPDAFAPLVTDLWAKMDAPEPARRFFSGLRVHLRHFNGWLFRDAIAIELRREQIRELLGAARARWTDVEPAIFGTMLEQAIDPAERSRLGAHYTPRAYVERLATATIMEPLRADWQRVQTQAEQAQEDGDSARAIEIVRQFLHKLCTVRVLDPACGTGNFLYVALELMKRLEGDVIDVMVRLGGDEPVEGDTIDPHQFLGIETNPRAAAIAQLVLWIGYPADRFPVLHTLTAMIAENPSNAPGLAALEPGPINDVHVQLQVAGAADVHFHRFGPVATTEAARAAVLRPVMNGLLKKRLDMAVLAPIALTRFDFDRLRLAPNAFIMRMSPQLQKARWSGKAYGANGHDAVLAAATHAFVLTGWGLPNDNFWALGRTLSFRTPAAREAIEVLFAALRLVTGIETGYAQEVRLARGWGTWPHLDWPQVFAVGARRYPEVFDDFGWTRDDIPVVTAIQMKEVATTYQAMKSQTAQRLDLALRRFNAATTRDDPSDAILDATIALEILLGDADNQAIGWKLRMRAGALAGIGDNRHRPRRRGQALRPPINHRPWRDRKEGCQGGQGSGSRSRTPSGHRNSARRSTGDPEVSALPRPAGHRS